ncbi:MAG TPA: hypothetical protein VL944_00505 [Candidatus Acidoferrum sp.]|nr:hypothetical protein [Candidatus Acidoferrum sp.]
MAEQKGEGKADQKADLRAPETIILKDKQAKILVSLRTKDQEWYISSLAKATGTTYVHACHFLTMCNGLGVTTSERHGKIKVIKLTEKGAQVAELIANLYGLLEPQPQKQEKKE